jgi:hypothetical protein
MKAYKGVEVQFHAFLPSALNGGGCSASRPDRFTPRTEPSVLIKQKVEWDPELVWGLQKIEISLLLMEITDE